MKQCEFIVMQALAAVVPIFEQIYLKDQMADFSDDLSEAEKAILDLGRIGSKL